MSNQKRKTKQSASSSIGYEIRERKTQRELAGAVLRKIERDEEEKERKKLFADIESLLHFAHGDVFVVVSYELDKLNETLLGKDKDWKQVVAANQLYKRFEYFDKRKEDYLSLIDALLDRQIPAIQRKFLLFAIKLLQLRDIKTLDRFLPKLSNIDKRMIYGDTV